MHAKISYFTVCGVRWCRPLLVLYPLTITAICPTTPRDRQTLVIRSHGDYIAVKPSAITLYNVCYCQVPTHTH